MDKYAYMDKGNTDIIEIIGATISLMGFFGLLYLLLLLGG